MPRGGFRPGAGRPKGTGKAKTAPKAKPAPAAEPEDLSSRPQFDGPQAFGVWALNAPDAEVSMDQKLKAMQTLAAMEMKQAAAQPSKQDQQKEAVDDAMTGLYEPRKAKGFSVVDGGK